MRKREPKRGQAKRDLLFSIYSKNLSFYIPGSSNQFLCPVCENVISEEDLSNDPFKISLAHIIPESIGGLKKTLACKACDNRIGAEFDSHLSKEIKLIKQFNGDEGIYSVLRCGDKQYKGMFGGHLFDYLGYNGKEDCSIFMKPPNKFPLDLWKRNLEEILGSGKFDLVLPSRPFDIQKRNISHIYSAFLLMFAKFGYEYALSPNVDILQEAFMGDYLHTNIYKLVFDLPKSLIPTKIPAISMIVEPKEFRAFFVTLQSPVSKRVRCVLLPGFGKGGNECYNNLLDKIAMGLKYKFELKEFSLCKSESHLNDIRFKGYGNWVWDSLIKMADYPETKAVASDQGLLISRD